MAMIGPHNLCCSIAIFKSKDKREYTTNKLFTCGKYYKYFTNKHILESQEYRWNHIS